MANALALPALSPEQGLRAYMQEIQKFPILSAEEEYMLAKRWVEDTDYDAAHKLVTSHLRLVAKIAHGFKGYGLPVAELISEGNIGLMQAVKKFDPEKGFRLSTYAMWWIKASIQEFVLRSWSVVKVGTSAAQKRLFFNLRRTKRALDLADDSDIPPEELAHIAKQLDVSERDVVAMDRRMNANDQHLNARMSNDGEGGEFIDMLADESESQEDMLGDLQEMGVKRGLLQDALAKLNDRERQIIIERKLAEEPKTLEELSQVFGVSRERVRQIEARAMEKLTESVQSESATKLLSSAA